jgi:hypothetical protein
MSENRIQRIQQGIGWVMTERVNIARWLGVVLIGLLGYEIGLIQATSRSVSPIVIERPAETVDAPALVTPVSPDTPKPSVAGVATAAPLVTGACPYIGSRNSDKYHLSTCAVAKRIKTENRVCFASPEDARTKGYQAGCVK